MTYDLLICTGLFPPDVGGPATYSKLLLDELPKRGVKVKVLSFGEVRHLPKLVRHLSYAWRVFKLIPKANAVYAQDPVSVGLPVMIACALRRRPYFIKIVGDYAWEQGSQRFGVKDLLDEFSVQNNYRWPVRLLKKIELTVARRARKIIMPSEYLKKIISNWGVNTEKITVIYNSFDEPMEVLLEKEVLRRELGLAGQVMVSVGRLVPWKGFPMLIDLLGGELGRQYPNLKLYIIGGGPERKLLNQMVTEKGLNDRVFLTGNKLRNDVLRYLKAADIFVLNTSYEGLSHQLLEVMWCGTPIVTTAVGGNPETIENGVSGLLVGYNDQVKLTEAIGKILADSALAARLAQNARVKVLFFNKERMLNELINILELKLNDLSH